MQRNYGRDNLTHIDSKMPKTSDNKMLPLTLAGDSSDDVQAIQVVYVSN